MSGKVKIIIYDIMGRKVRTLYDGVQEAGLKSVLWDSADDNKDLGTGIYFYTIKTGTDFKKVGCYYEMIFSDYPILN